MGKEGIRGNMGIARTGRGKLEKDKQEEEEQGRSWRNQILYFLVLISPVPCKISVHIIITILSKLRN